MTKPRGGRGKVAPYTTRQVRVPEPIVNQVDELIERYQTYIASGGDAANPPVLMNECLKPVYKFIEVSQAVDVLQKALKLKANAGGAIKNKIKEVLELLSD